MPRIELSGRGTVAGGLSSVIGRGTVLPAAPIPEEVEGAGTVSGAVFAAARPRGEVQRPGFEIFVAGALVPMEDLTGTIEVVRSLNNRAQTWRFQTPLVAGVGRFGSPWGKWAPPLGKRSVRVDGVYLTPSGLVRQPLIAEGGICDTCQRSIGSAGHVESHSGLDSVGRIDRRTVTYKLPPGAGVRRNRIAQQALAQLGETSFGFEPDQIVHKEVQLIDADPLAVLSDMFDTSNRRLLKDRNGVWRNPELGRRRSPVLEIEERDILTVSDVSDTHNGDVITRVTLIGNEQVLCEPEEGDACLVEVKIVPSEISQPYEPRRASFIQNSGGALNPLSNPPYNPREMLITLFITTTETRCGVVVSERVQEWGFQWIETARRVYSSGAGDFIHRGGVYIDQDGTVDGSEPAYIERSERWRLKTETLTRHYYARDFFYGPQGATSDPWWNHFNKPTGGNVAPGNGFRLGSISEGKAWYAPRAAIKAAVGGQSWEETDPINGVLVLGNGEGVVSAAQQFIVTSRQVEVVKSSPDGFVDSVTVHKLGWQKRPGRDFQYADGFPSSQGEESFDRIGFESTVYSVGAGERGHSIITSRYAFDGAPRFQESRRDKGTGNRPEVDRLEDIDVEQEDVEYASDEEAAERKMASRFKSRPIKVSLVVGDLEEHHLESPVKTSLPWAETIEELTKAAIYMVLRSAAVPVSFTTAANFYVAEGDWIRLRMRLLGIDADVEVQTVRHQGAVPNGPFVTTWDVLVYPEIV